MVCWCAGVLDVGRLSDKSHHFLHRSGVRVEQVCLYSNQNDSLLYQEMLTYKAGEASFDLIRCCYWLEIACCNVLIMRS